MRLLLDTHLAIWAVLRDPRLSAGALKHITDSRNTVFVSLVSVWEIAIKRGTASRSSADPIPFSAQSAATLFEQAGYHLLPLSLSHAARVEDLPFLHRDPFDRMLVAQALSEPLNLVTHDAQVAAYSPSFILV